VVRGARHLTMAMAVACPHPAMRWRILTAIRRYRCCHPAAMAFRMRGKYAGVMDRSTRRVIHFMYGDCAHAACMSPGVHRCHRGPTPRVGTGGGAALATAARPRRSGNWHLKQFIIQPQWFVETLKSQQRNELRQLFYSSTLFYPLSLEEHRNAYPFQT